MLPIILDVKARKAGIIGGGARACRRLAMLDEAGAENVTIYCTKANAQMRQMAGARLVERLPSADDINALAVLFIADIDDADVTAMVKMAHRCGVLVNVEDVPSQCDFHVPAITRRGALLLTASTGGKSPALARRLKEFCATRFPTIWADRVAEISTMRENWRSEGLDSEEIMQRSNKLIDEKEWLACQCLLEKEKSN